MRDPLYSYRSMCGAFPCIGKGKHFIWLYVLFFIFYTTLIRSDQQTTFCDYNEHLSPAISSLLCAVERKHLTIHPDAKAVKAAANGCMLGRQIGKNGKESSSRCNSILDVPTRQEVPKSSDPKLSTIKEYTRLATISESFIEKTWWREGFSSDYLLLSHNDSELPRNQFVISKLRHKKLKNIIQCVTRQQFIRKSYDMNVPGGILDRSKFNKDEAKTNCTSFNHPDVQLFYKLWMKNANKGMFDGTFRYPENPEKGWEPRHDDQSMRESALNTLGVFYDEHGGIWTGCFKFDRFPSCRGAIAAASLVTAMHTLTDITGPDAMTFHEHSLLSGYFMASLGRSVLHGHDGNIGDESISVWKVKTIDFIALQQAFLKLYMDSFGGIYNKQLEKYVPMSFPPSFEVYIKNNWQDIARNNRLEPVYTSLRNWMYHEAKNLIDFGPYKPIVAEAEVRSKVKKNYKRRVLIDVGANGFFASPKYLLDSYSIYAPFTHAIMIEPEPHFSASIPPIYSKLYNITFIQIYSEVGTGTDNDILKLLPTLVSKDDFVVLKYDVDPNRFAYGATMEWGFLFMLMKTKDIAQLIDELYIELHFHFPALFWDHFHSNWEALDAIRYLRSRGLPIHSWP